MNSKFSLQVTPAVREANLKSFEKRKRKCLYPSEKQEEDSDPCFVDVQSSINKRIGGNLERIHHSICQRKGLHLLKRYSQSGCFFECQVQRALKDRHTTGGYEHGFCIPWMFPSLYNNSICKYS